MNFFGVARFQWNEEYGTFEGGDGEFKGGKYCVNVGRLHALRSRILCVFSRAWKSSFLGHGNHN